MKPIYANFDGLDVSFQCAVSEEALNILADAKARALDMRGDAVAKIGPTQTAILVGETGSRGGFTYRFDTGFHGETWFIVRSHKRDGWNVKVSVKSLTLALYGYSGAKEKILKFLLDDLGAIGPLRRDAIGESIEFPIERVSRIDYCIDYRTDHFIPIAGAFVGKGRFKKKVLYADPENGNTSEIIFSGQNPQYFRIGSMPNRQVVLYDKISDITAKKKNYWWDIWGIKKSEFSGQIWRVEIRAGKKELNQWNLRRFSDFEKMAGNVISGILQDIKYTTPSDTDKNITRWPKAQFWQEAINIAREKLQNHMSDAKRKMIIEGYRNQLSDQFEKSILGQSISYAALHGMDVSEIPGVLDVLGEAMLDRVKQNPKKYREKHENSLDKYSQLKG